MRTFDNGTDLRPRSEVAVQSALMAVIMLSATAGNAVVLFLLWKFRALRSRTAAFISSLAVADLAVGATGMPLVLASSLAGWWPASHGFCVVNGMTNVVFCVASMLTLAGIALDRYAAIVHPFRYQELMSGRRMAALLVWIWLEPLILAVLPVATSWSRYKYFHNEYICTIDWGYSASLSCAIFLAGFFTPLGVMCYCYARILKVARGQSRKIADTESLGASAEARRARQLRRDAKAAMMLLILIGNFLACWCPHFVGILCLVFADDECPFPDAVFTATTWLAMANSGLNPFIYGLLDRRLRQAFWLALRCRFRQRLATDPNTSAVSVE